MDSNIIAIFLLLLIIYATRTIIGISNKKLEQSKKAELVDLFSKARIFTFGILILIIALYVLSLKLRWFEPIIIYIGYGILVFLYVILTSILSYKKLKNNNFPDFYIKSYILTTSIRILGLIFFFILAEF
jgi:hypothetical protein